MPTPDFEAIRKKKTRRLVGLMSGTSADGVDAVLCEIAGSGRDTRAKIVRMTSTGYPESLRNMLLGDLRLLSCEEVARLNFRIGEIFTDTALQCVSEAGLTPRDIDAVCRTVKLSCTNTEADHPVIPVPGNASNWRHLGHSTEDRDP